jgi:hypothetical protein
MHEQAAVAALYALAPSAGLAAFRRLIRAGRQGLAARELEAAVNDPAVTLSDYLEPLERAGLVSSRRDQGTLVYAADFDGMNELWAFLMATSSEEVLEFIGKGSA